MTSYCCIRATVGTMLIFRFQENFLLHFFPSADDVLRPSQTCRRAATRNARGTAGGPAIARFARPSRKQKQATHEGKTQPPQGVWWTADARYFVGAAPDRARVSFLRL